MSQTSRFVQEKAIVVPKHLLKYRDEISPYGKVKSFKNSIGSRILVNTKKVKSGLVRGQTMSDKTSESDIANLITVERNYVRELINSPFKFKSKSPLLPHSHKVPNSSKGKLTKNRFDSLTVCDFLVTSGKRKTAAEGRRAKFSFTPEIPTKRKN